MSAVLKEGWKRSFGAICRRQLSFSGVTSCTPSCSLSSHRLYSTKQDNADPKDEGGPEPATSKSWFQKLIPIRQIDPGKESHSNLLADKDVVYELQLHKVKPDQMEGYLNQFGTFVDLLKRKNTGAELVGSWTVEIGDQDEAIHLWRYPGGYPQLHEATEIYRTDKEFIDFRLNRNKMIRSRKNQILLAFSFWGDIKEREEKSIYELRSYILKPGTMIEWGNNWVKGIKSRQTDNEAVAGFFSHIGDLYQVHHFWGYSDLAARKQVREMAWARPGWDDCVAHTVPLIRKMTARILIPTPFSPLK